MIDVNLMGMLYGIAAALPVFGPAEERSCRQCALDGWAQDFPDHGRLRRDEERDADSH